MSRTELDKWAELMPRYMGAMEFIEWLSQEKSVFLDFEAAKPGTKLGLRELLDEFFQIDQSQLDRERRALLEQLRRAPKPVKVDTSRTLRLPAVERKHQDKKDLD